MRLSYALILSLLISVSGWAQTPANEADLLRTVEQQSRESSRLFQEKKYDEGIKILEQLCAAPGIRDLEGVYPALLYNLACGFALTGQKDKAVVKLENAVAAGFSDLDLITKDTDLTSIRDDLRFRQTVVKLQAENSRWNDPALSTPYRPNLSEDEKIAGLAKLWLEIKNNFVYFDRCPGLSTDSLFLSYLPKVRSAPSTRDYYSLLMEFCAQFRDGHTMVDVPNELFLDMYSRLPFDTRLVEDKVLITALLSDSLQEEGVRVGMEIISVDGIPVGQYAKQNILPYISASTSQSRRAETYELYLLCGSNDKPVELGLKDASGHVITKRIPRSYHRILSFEKSVEFQLLPGNIAYVALNSFGSSAVTAAFDSLFPAIGKSRALIVDVRRNTGGNSDEAFNILGYLTDKPIALFTTSERDYRPFRRAMGRPLPWIVKDHDSWPPDGSKYFDKPVVVLSSALTASAADDFCMAFDAMQRGTIIGEPTAGSTGQPLNFSLPGGGRGRVCTIHCMYPDGKEYVGVGVQPQLVVHPTVSDVRAGNDTVLRAAQTYLATKIQK
jgi:carboxyl-terminal processing protease